MNKQQNTSSDEQLSPLPVRLFRTFVVAAALIAFGAAMGFCDQPHPSPQQSNAMNNAWATDWSEAVEASKATGKPIMLMFTGSDWCQWSQKLEQEVVSDREFHEWSDRVIKIRVDFPENQTLSKLRHAQNKVLKDWYSDFVTSYPTCLFVEPNGRVIGTVGFVEGGATLWIDRAEGVLLDFGDLTARASFNSFLR